MSNRLGEVILRGSVRIALYRQMIKDFHKEMSKIIHDDKCDLKFKFNNRLILKTVMDKLEILHMDVNLFEKAVLGKIFPQLSNFSLFQKFIQDKVELYCIFGRICPFCYHIIERDYGPNRCNEEIKSCGQYLRCPEWCVNFYNKKPIKVCSHEHCENLICDNCDCCDFHARHETSLNMSLNVI